jgi:hypothetical protein
MKRDDGLKATVFQFVAQRSAFIVSSSSLAPSIVVG